MISGAWIWTMVFLKETSWMRFSVAGLCASRPHNCYPEASNGDETLCKWSYHIVLRLDFILARRCQNTKRVAPLQSNEEPGAVFKRALRRQTSPIRSPAEWKEDSLRCSPTKNQELFLKERCEGRQAPSAVQRNEKKTRPAAVQRRAWTFF